jgi:hypothetical protein
MKKPIIVLTAEQIEEQAKAFHLLNKTTADYVAWFIRTNPGHRIIRNDDGTIKHIEKYQ